MSFGLLLKSAVTALAFSIVSFQILAGTPPCGLIMEFMQTELIRNPISLSNDSTASEMLNLRQAQPEDIPKTTELIHSAFEVWKARGLRLSPMFQNDESTRSHLTGKGFVGLDSSGNILVTFSTDHGALRKTDSAIVEFFEGKDPALPFKSISTAPIDPARKYIVFKKFAVSPTVANRGVGVKVYNLFERSVRAQDYDGVIIETVREADWLFAWYLKLGFRQMGEYQYPGSPVMTVLMVKDFEKGKGS
jgi:predicted N-acetyltransferase YhbS